MGRRKLHAPLAVLFDSRLVVRLAKGAGGAVSFQYAAEWLDWLGRFPISLSLPLPVGEVRGGGRGRVRQPAFLTVSASASGLRSLEEGGARRFNRLGSRRV